MRCPCWRPSRQAMPDAQVDWLVEENYASILSIASGLHRRIIVRARRSFETPDAISFGGLRGYHAAAKYLWNQDYDVALDLQGLIKSSIWARISFANRVVGFDAREPARAAGRVPVFGNGDAGIRQSGSQAVGPSGQHVIQKNLSILSALEDHSRMRSRCRSSRTHRRRPPPRSRRPAAARRFIVLNPGAAWPNKRWPAERFGALAASLRDRFGLPSLITWGPSEQDLADAVARASSRRRHAGAGDIGVGSRGADARGRAGGVRRYRAAAHRRRDGHAAGWLVRSDLARAQRAVGSGRCGDLARQRVRVPSQAPVPARRAVHQRDQRWMKSSRRASNACSKTR